MNLRDINLSVLLKERIKKCQKLYLDDKDLEFSLDIEDNLYVECDEYHIAHTIDNLLINAINYSKNGTIVQIALKRSGDTVEFSIRDEGVGIPPSELFDIFRPFTVSSKTRSTAGGRGVGLSLCHAVLEAHNGKIWAESDGESWAEFKFSLK